MFATRARKNVENSRLLLDAAKAKAKNPGWHLPGQAAPQHDGHEDEIQSEEARIEIEQAEDEFVGQTEEAVGVMKNVCFVEIPSWEMKEINPQLGPRYPRTTPKPCRSYCCSTRIP